jgi:hypothetical protein
MLQKRMQLKIMIITKCEGTDKSQGTEAALSDHYPVRCMFYVDRVLIKFSADAEIILFLSFLHRPL